MALKHWLNPILVPRILLVRGVAVALVVAILAGAFTVIRHNRGREMSQQTHSLLSYDAVLAEQTSRAVQGVQLVVDNVADDLLVNGVATPTDLERRATGLLVHQHLRSLVSGVPQLDAVTIVNTEGRVVNFSRFFPIPPINVADRDYFKALSGDSGPVNFLSAPVENRGTGTWTIFVAHRLSAPDGHFLGLVLGAIQLSYFEKFYHDVDMGEGGTITLWRQDGILLARFPSSDGIGAQYNRRARFENLAAGMRRDFVASDTLDGQERIVVVTRLASLPLVVGVSRSVDVVLQDWRADSTVVALAALICTLAVLVTMLILTRQIRANEELAQALHARDAAELGRHEAESQLLQAQKLEAIGRVAAGVAHDFNNLLTVVLSNVQMLSGIVRGDPTASRRLSTIGHAVERGAALTQQMLAFSRQQILAPAAINLNVALQAVSELLRSSLGGDIPLELRLAPQLWLVHVDPGQLEHSLLNLALNARHAMSNGGRVVIATSNRVLMAGEEHGMLRPGKYVDLCFSDTGTGMTDEVVAQAFDPFFTTRPQGEGSGLGLSQLLGFVRQSNGDVTIETAPGCGTKIRILLPKVPNGVLTQPDNAATDEATTTAAEAAAHTPMPAQEKLPPNAMPPKPGPGPISPGAGQDPARPTVMVVDDDDDVREVVVTILRYQKINVVPAAGGEAALALLALHPQVRLVLTDFAMPGMDGAEFAAEVRFAYPDLPLVFMTGYARPEPLAKERWVVRKPFTTRQLADTVFDALAEYGRL